MDVIFDVDGTLMDLDHRRKFLDGSMGKKDWSGFVNATKDDTPKDQIHSVAKALAAQGHRIIILTGRNQAQHDITALQLKDIPYDTMVMRPDDNYDADQDLKAGMLDYLINSGYNPTLVFDDRDAVVNMWRDKGLICCQVAPGDF